VVGHVSEENNHSDLLDEAFRPRAEKVCSLTFATQDEGAWWTELADEVAPAGQVGRLAF